MGMIFTRKELSCIHTRFVCVIYFVIVGKRGMQNFVQQQGSFVGNQQAQQIVRDIPQVAFDNFMRTVPYCQNDETEQQTVCEEMVVTQIALPREYQQQPNASDGPQAVRYEYSHLKVRAIGNVPYLYTLILVPSDVDIDQIKSRAMSGYGLLSKFNIEATRVHGIELIHGPVMSTVGALPGGKGTSGCCSVSFSLPHTIRLAVGSGYKLYSILCFSRCCDGNLSAHVDVDIEGLLRMAWTGTEIIQKGGARGSASAGSRVRGVSAMNSDQQQKKKKKKKKKQVVTGHTTKKKKSKKQDGKKKSTERRRNGGVRTNRKIQNEKVMHGHCGWPVNLGEIGSQVIH